MGIWTAEEIRTELARRDAKERRRDREYGALMRTLEAERANAICMHCGNPFISYAEDSPLCDTCLGDD